MKPSSIISAGTVTTIAGSTGLLAWWFSMPVFLPVSEAGTDFQAMVLDPDWIWVNLVGLVSVLLLSLGFPGLYLHSHENPAGQVLPGHQLPSPV